MVFASALLGGIDLRFYEAAAAAAAGSGGRHLILSFLEKEGERDKEKAREREKRYVVYTHPVVYGCFEEFFIFFLIFLFFFDSIPYLTFFFLKHTCIHKVIRYIHPMD